jgi:uridine kinase
MQSGKTELMAPANVVILDGILALHIEEIRTRGDIKLLHKYFVEPSIDFADLIIPYYEGNTIAIDLVATKILNLLHTNK